MADNLSLQIKYQTLQRQIVELDKQIEELHATGVTTDLRPEIKALHDYNEMKDLTQEVLGNLANVEQVLVSELHVRYNLPLD